MELLSLYQRMTKLESNGSNWVVFKIRLFVSIAAHGTNGLDETDICPANPRLSMDVAANWAADEQKEFSGYQIELVKGAPESFRAANRSRIGNGS